MGAQKTPPCEGQGFLEVEAAARLSLIRTIHPFAAGLAALPAQHEGKSAKAEQCG